MFFKEVTDDKTKYSLTKQGISFIKSFIVIISMIALCFSLSYTSVVEARSEVSEPKFTRGSEEIIASKEKAAQKVDSIMTAEDFLGEGERAADFEDIHEYLKELNAKGIINDNKSNEIEDEDISLSDGDAENEDIASENLNENTSLDLLECWDSLAKVSFIAFAASEYGALIGAVDLMNAKNIIDLIKIIN